MGGQRLCSEAIGSPAHSSIASRLSCAGYFAAAGPSAKACRTLAVTFRVKWPTRRFRPYLYQPPKDATQNMVPVLNTPAPLGCV
jgi:hypothetical protein